MTIDDLYLNDARYILLVEAVLNASPSIMSGQVGHDEVKLALGAAGLWPASIKTDVRDAEASERRLKWRRKLRR